MAKILLSMPDELLEEIDAAVARRLRTRSAFLRSAARDALARPDPVAIRAAVGRARAAIADLGNGRPGKLGSRPTAATEYRRTGSLVAPT